MRQRDIAIDYAKGIAILLVYLGHSIIYHPIQLALLYNWCDILEIMISSFNMPMFFFISGLLFAYSKKSNLQIIKDKIYRLFIPYLFTMILVLIAKQLMPSGMAYKSVTGINILIDIFVYGGDRWFVYVLMWIFLFSLPIRKIAKKYWVFGIIAVCFMLTILDVMPRLFLLKDVVRFMPFFLIGMFLSQCYTQVKSLTSHYLLAIIVIFALMNIIFVKPLIHFLPMKYILLPLTGTICFMALAFWMERFKTTAAASYVAYCGRYSLQFYLFTFAYPLIRYAVVVLWHISNPFVIVFMVMTLQLIIITILIEITKRIKILKIPMGY